MDNDTLELEDLSIFSGNVVLYIAGFVVKKVIGELDCPCCAFNMYASESDLELIAGDAKLTMLRDHCHSFLSHCPAL